MSSIIEFSEIRKSFGDREILKGISFEVKAAEILFVLGTSGTGKSVMLKNLVGLMRPDSGDIYFQGQEISRKSEEEYFEIRKKCSLVFQQPALFDSMSVFENLAFGLRRLQKLEAEELEKRVKSCLQSVELSEEILPLFPSETSYGMQKRIGIARSLCLRPEVLLFDEPTTGLDPVSTTAINQLIYRLSRKHQTTSIVVSHDMKCALDIADQIVVLDQGYIIASGTPEEMKKSRVPLVKEFLSEVLDG